jgi:hypothetical protein
LTTGGGGLRQFCQPRNATLTGLRRVARGTAHELVARRTRPHRTSTSPIEFLVQSA